MIESLNDVREIFKKLANRQTEIQREEERIAHEAAEKKRARCDALIDLVKSWEVPSAIEDESDIVIKKNGFNYTFIKYAGCTEVQMRRRIENYQDYAAYRGSLPFSCRAYWGRL